MRSIAFDFIGSFKDARKSVEAETQGSHTAPEEDGESAQQNCVKFCIFMMLPRSATISTKLKPRAALT